MILIKPKLYLLIIIIFTLNLYSCDKEDKPITNSSHISNVQSKDEILKIKDIKSSGDFSMFFFENGDLAISGENSYGILGQGNTDSYSKPKFIDLKEKIKLIDAGYGSCIAIGESNTLYYWGISLKSPKYNIDKFY